MGDRAHSRVDHAQSEDEPRLRVLVRDDGGSDLRGDDPTDAQKARQRGLMRPSQTPSEKFVPEEVATWHMYRFVRKTLSFSKSRQMHHCRVKHYPVHTYPGEPHEHVAPQKVS